VLLRVPHEVIKATPLIVVISVFAGIGNMLKHNEILMLYIAGYSPWRIGAPLAVILILLIGCFFWINENISAPFAEKAQLLMETRIRGGAQSIAGANEIWLLGSNNRIFLAKDYTPHTRMIRGLYIFEFQGDKKTLSRRLYAQRSVWNPKEGWWVLYDVIDHHILPDGSIERKYYPQSDYFLERTPDDFGRIALKPEQMSHEDLAEVVQGIESAGYDPQLYLPDLRIKEAFPFAIFCLGMLAFGIILRHGIRASASGIGLGIMIAIAYMMFLSLGKSFSRTGFLPAWFGAWAPNFLCLAWTLFTFYKLKDEV
jgi:lipopolysaccharide export system permease protein